MLLYLALVCVVLVLSTFYVLRLGRSSADPSSAAPPPRVPYWLPFVGNALAFGRDSQGYLQRCQQQYGDAFRLKMMGQDYVFVLDPFSFPNVFREEKKNLSFIAIVKEFACKCFGASEDEFEKQNHETVHKQFITYLQGLELPALTTRMRDHLERAVKEKTQPQLQGQAGAEWQHGQMWHFVMEVLYVAGTRAFFGDTFEVEQSYKDFFAFDDNFPAFTIGVPDLLLGKSVQARKRMNDKLVHLTDPTASKLMIERERYLAEETTIPPLQLSRLQFATFWAAHGNTLPSAFWSLAYILSDERAKREITEEVFSLFHKKDTGRETFAKLKDMVKLDSAINEALRLSSASIIVREVMNDFTLKLQNGNHFLIHKGQKMAMYPYLIHNNPEVYENPQKYQFDRFLVEDSDDDEDDVVKAAAVATNGMERVESVDMLHIKQRELRQLRESRRRDRDIRDSRHSVATATSVDQAQSSDEPTTSVDLREQTLKDLRASGRLFSRILRESQSRVAVGPSSEDRNAANETKECTSHSSPEKSPKGPAAGITISQLLQREEEEEASERDRKASEHEREEEQEVTTTPKLPARRKGSDSRRFNPASSPLQEQLSSSGEVDLSSPLFLRRAQRMRKNYADDVDAQSGDKNADGNKSNTGSSPNSPLRRPSLVSIQVNLVDINPEPSPPAAEEEEKAEVPLVETTPLRTSGPRSKHLLNLTTLSKRDRSVSLGVIPQQLILPDQVVAVDNNHTVPNDSSATSAALFVPTLSHNLPLSTEPAATSASVATAGLASPRVSREQHLAFKKRERTGSFNIPGDHRLMARRQEKKFYYKGRELRYHLMPFGGGGGMCPGRYFARNELKLFVAVMIYYFDLELLPNEQGEIKLPPLDETRLGIGILPPARDLPFRFRLRDEHLADFQLQQP